MDCWSVWPKVLNDLSSVSASDWKERSRRSSVIFPEPRKPLEFNNIDIDWWPSWANTWKLWVVMMMLTMSSLYCAVKLARSSKQCESRYFNVYSATHHLFSSSENCFFKINQVLGFSEIEIFRSYQCQLGATQSDCEAKWKYLVWKKMQQVWKDNQQWKWSVDVTTFWHKESTPPPPPHCTRMELNTGNLILDAERKEKYSTFSSYSKSKGLWGFLCPQISKCSHIPAVQGCAIFSWGQILLAWFLFGGWGQLQTAWQSWGIKVVIWWTHCECGGEFWRAAVSAVTTQPLSSTLLTPFNYF